jgi:oligosaccharide repeat unit polymerase
MATVPITWTAGSGAPFAKRFTIERFLLAQVAATVVVAGVSASLAAGVIPSVNAASVVFTLCITWMLFSWARIVHTIVSPYWIFVLVAALFNGGQALLQVFGLNPSGVLESSFSIVTTSSTIIYASLSMMLLHCGALWRMTREREQAPEPVSEDLERGAVWLGLLLVVVSIAPMYLQLREDFGDVLNVGYMGLYQRELRTNIDAWQALLAQFMLPGAFLLAAASKRYRGIQKLSLALALIYALSYLFMGYRSAAGAAIAAFGWIWHTRVSKLPLYPSLAVGVLVVFVVFPMIRLHRITTGEDRLSWNSFLSTLDNYDNPASASLTEMGGTMSTLAYTMDLVPNDREYEYGKTYAFAALTILPNIFGTARHPSVERGTASDWLVRTVSYNTASQGGGLGFSFLAEAYLNFGWAGPPLVMILLGFGFAAVECFAARNASPAATSLMGVILFFGLIYARAESTDIVRSIVWCGFIPLAVLALFVAQKHLWRRPSLTLRRRTPERSEMA